MVEEVLEEAAELAMCDGLFPWSSGTTTDYFLGTDRSIIHDHISKVQRLYCYEVETRTSPLFLPKLTLCFSHVLRSFATGL